MRSLKLGKNISKVEVLNISTHGIWLYAGEKEHFLSFKDYPWFKDAKIADIYNVELLWEDHLYWPTLDIDLELGSLENPSQFPLLYK